MPGLDGLRAVAVLAVIAYHLNFGWAQGGMLGVGVFFVLSGYLITNLLLVERDRTGTIVLGEFWRRRARRLFPALWVMLGVVVLWVAIAQPSQVPALRGDVLSALFYYSNWWYVAQHVAYFANFGPPSPLGHLWSLAVEEQFYVVWPLVLAVGAFLFPRRPRRFVPLVLRLRPSLGMRPLRPVLLVLVAAAASAVLMAVLWSPGADPDRVYYGTDTRAFELLLGAALAYVWPSRRVISPLRSGQRLTLDLAGFAGLAAIVALVVLTDQYSPFVYRGGLVLLSVATVAVIAAAAHPSTLTKRLLSVAPLRWLGVRSYGVYLWHFPVILLTTPLVDTAGSHLLRTVLQVGGTLVIAAVSWRFVEEPVRRNGFGVLLAPLRWTRDAIPGRVTALSHGAVASVLLAGAAGALLIGLSVPIRGTASSSQLASSSSVQAATAPAAGITCTQPASDGTDVTAIGDSIMVLLSPYLSQQLPGITVDGIIGAQVYQLPDVLATLHSQGRLQQRLVIELGTNDPFDESELVRALRALPAMQRIALVNVREPRPWESDVNATLAEVARKVPHTVLVDWHSASAGHPDWFLVDGLHPNATGAPVLASMIAKAISPAPAPSPSAIGCT